MTPPDVLRTAATQLRNIAPQITDPLSDLADPVAGWLEATADEMNLVDGTEYQATGNKSADPSTWVIALTIARKILDGA